MVTLDGNQLLSLTDTTRRGGMAGFASSYNANMFDDLIVEPVGANGTIPTKVLGEHRVRGAGQADESWDGGVLFRQGSGDQVRILRPDGKVVNPRE